jgi:hypothetical protein
MNAPIFRIKATSGKSMKSKMQRRRNASGSTPSLFEGAPRVRQLLYGSVRWEPLLPSTRPLVAAIRLHARVHYKNSTVTYWRVKCAMASRAHSSTVPSGEHLALGPAALLELALGSGPSARTNCTIFARELRLGSTSRARALVEPHLTSHCLPFQVPLVARPNDLSLSGRPSAPFDSGHPRAAGGIPMPPRDRQRRSPGRRLPASRARSR